MLAPWPSAGPIDEGAIEQWETVQALIRAIRNTRQEYSVEPARWIAATIVSAGLATPLAASRDVLAALARIDDGQLDIATALGDAPEQAAQIVVGDGLTAYLPLAGMVDLDQERARLQKQIDETDSEVQRLEARLANEGFVSNAPAHIVDGAREQLAGAQERLARLRERVGDLV
ncbi:MAG: hypothetical protein H6637_01175 [Ardenticatenales bacterium]|nr:hypothetical protein [Ardenticatenales bacterium]